MDGPGRIRKLHEFDWLLSSTHRILKALSEILHDIDRELHTAEEEYEKDDAIELAENTLGLAFVVAQVYITGTIANLNRMASPPRRITKEESISQFGVPLKDRGVTDLQFCDAMANYYKHHDEWHALSKEGRHTKTVSVLHAAGIDEQGPHPCVQAGELIFLSPGPYYLDRLMEMLSQWRHRQIAALTEPPEDNTADHRGA
jgi:hypothetical protein